MICKRIIPCLDVKEGKVVKGKNFENMKDAGDAVELAKEYYAQGADELVFLDISATVEKRKTMKELAEKVSEQIFIPFTIGGGIRGIEEINELLRAGADKVSLNSAAVKNPGLVKEAAGKFGSQAIVVAIDAKKVGSKYKVFIESGKKETEYEVLEWAKKVERLGAGEILLTSIDADGTKSGFDLKLTRQISENAGIPVIASGGAGSLESIYEAFKKGKADAVLAASIFHYKKYSIREVKNYLSEKGLEMRI